MLFDIYLTFIWEIKLQKAYRDAFTQSKLAQAHSKILTRILRIVQSSPTGKAAANSTFADPTQRKSLQSLAMMSRLVRDILTKYRERLCQCEVMLIKVNKDKHMICAGRGRPSGVGALREIRKTTERSIGVIDAVQKMDCGRA